MLKKLTGIGKKEKKRVSIQEEHTVFTESNTKRRVIPPETTPQLSNGNGVANGRSVPIVRTDKIYRNGTLGDNTDSEHWHMEHFVCTTCNSPLAGARYLVKEDQPHCVTCFEQQHANCCDECQKPIGINSKDLSYKERHWHEVCFVCTQCKKSLLQQPFGSKQERIYCGECYDELFGTRCDACSEVFKPGQKKLEYKGKQWHETCFICSKCLGPIGTKSFVPKNDEIFCSECYEVKFATRCVKCCEIILANGVMFKDEPWHKQCFTCNECRIELAGTSFLVRDDRAYCRDCFGNKFSHKCAVCTKAIIGTSQQSTRFINFEEMYWHTECFACVDCKTRLEGRGFIRDGPDILCGDCAKFKLSADIEDQ